MEAKKNVNEIFSAALKAVDPSLIIKEHADRIQAEFISSGLKQIFLTGFGKASFQMAKAFLESTEPDIIKNGIVITKYGHKVRDELRVTSDESRKIKVYEASHPVPDENGLNATKEIIELLHTSDKETLILCLVSGGGSALLVSPYDGITLKDKQLVTDRLLKAGADITELNAVRKHLSKVKGGRLAQIAHPAQVISLMISDVIGDKPDVIASGPTAPDSSTFSDAIDVIYRYRLNESIPPNIMDMFYKGRDGNIPETPSPDNPIFNNVSNLIIGSNAGALSAAKDKAEELEFNTEIISSDLAGEAKTAGKRLAKKAIETRNTLHATHNKKKVCLISGGETTVTVKGTGKGGRNTELALSFAREIHGIYGITLLSAGTDGTDGPTDAAGAIVNGKTIDSAKSLELDPDEYMKNNDSYNFFKQINSLLFTGPTGTNVMDIQIIIIE